MSLFGNYRDGDRVTVALTTGGTLTGSLSMVGFDTANLTVDGQDGAKVPVYDAAVPLFNAPHRLAAASVEKIAPKPEIVKGTRGVLTLGDLKVPAEVTYVYATGSLAVLPDGAPRNGRAFGGIYLSRQAGEVTLFEPDKPKPAVPTEPGIYRTDDGETFVRDVNGVWRLVTYFDGTVREKFAADDMAYSVARMVDRGVEFEKVAEVTK